MPSILRARVKGLFDTLSRDSHVDNAILRARAPYSIPLLKRSLDTTEPSKTNILPFLIVGVAFIGGLGAVLSFDLDGDGATGEEEWLEYNIGLLGPFLNNPALKYALDHGVTSPELVQKTVPLERGGLSKAEKDLINCAYDENGEVPSGVKMIDFVLEDGAISSGEEVAINRYLQARDHLIPENLKPYWSVKERADIAYSLARQLFDNDGNVIPERREAAGLMMNFRRPIISVRGIQASVLEDFDGDIDNDGFTNIDELIADRNYLNPLETPETNDSEVYIVFLRDSEWAVTEDPYIYNNIAIKYGIPEDNIKILMGHVIGEYEGRNRYEYIFPEFGDKNLLHDYPTKNNIKKNIRKADLSDAIKNNLKLADENDVVYIHSSAEAPGFNIVIGKDLDSDKLIYERLDMREMLEILESVPRKGKTILINESCGGDNYIRWLVNNYLGGIDNFIGISSTRSGETSYGEFEIIFLRNLIDGYSLRDSVPNEYDSGMGETLHPVIYTGKGDHSWVNTYNMFGITKTPTS